MARNEELANVMNTKSTKVKHPSKSIVHTGVEQQFARKEKVLLRLRCALHRSSNFKEASVGELSVMEEFFL